LRLEVAKRDPSMTLTELLQQAQVNWHGVKLGEPDWGGESRALALTTIALDDALCFHIMFNTHCEALQFELPRHQDGQWGPWHRVGDTYRQPPEDFCDELTGPSVDAPTYKVGSRSVVILRAQAGADNQ
jgi:isoamylase